MNVSTVSGTMTLDQIKCRRLSGSVISGEVHAKDVSCDNAELKSLSGSVDYTGPLTKNGRYELQTHSGNVHVTITGSVGFELQASTFSGQVRLDAAPGAATGNDDAQVRPRHGRRRQRRRDRDRVQRRCGD